MFVIYTELEQPQFHPDIAGICNKKHNYEKIDPLLTLPNTKYWVVLNT